MKIIIASFIFVIFLLQCQSIKPGKMTTTILQQLKGKQDYVHHLVFFNQTVFNNLVQAFPSQLQQLDGQSDIKFYFNDCKANPMRQCQTSDKVPLMLLFNRIFIRFNGASTGNLAQQIYEWIVSRIAISPVLINNKAELQHQLTKTPELFCYCKGNDQQKAAFYSLSKAMVLTNYCVLQNQEFYSQLGLKSGNITMFKNGTLQHRIEFQYQNRYDMWQIFLKINAVNHIKKSEQFIRKRFSQQNKNIDTTIVICDFSFKCEQFWMQFQKWSRNFQQKYPNKQLAMTFFDQKQILLYNIYFHTVINYTQFPALLNVKILSQNGRAGWFRRYISYPDHVDQQIILDFLQNIQDGKVPPVYLSGSIPSKNGFTGKNADKLIQKVVAKNLNETIAKSQKHYVLFLSSANLGVAQADEFYSEYKKVASFLSDQDITFGYMDVLKNEIQIDAVQSIPQVLLYNKYFKNEPERMSGRNSFDGLMRFLENNAIVNYSTDL